VRASAHDGPTCARGKALKTSPGRETARSGVARRAGIAANCGHTGEPRPWPGAPQLSARYVRGGLLWRQQEMRSELLATMARVRRHPTGATIDRRDNGSVRLTILFSLAMSLFASLNAAENTPDVLQRQTQELFDAIPSGSATVWDRYLDDRASYTDEGGAVLAKKEMVEQLKPFPKEITGNIKVFDFRVTLHGSVAVTTHLDDEQETYYGHALHCQYRTTDTWIKTSAGWRLIATQVLALRTDPPPLRLAASQIQEYVGRYALTESKIYEIRMKDGDLEGQETGRAPEGYAPKLWICFSCRASRATARFSCATRAAESQALPSGVRLGICCGNDYRNDSREQRVARWER